MKRETLRDDRQIRIGDTKKLNCDEEKDVVPRNVELLLYNRDFRVKFLRYLVNYLWKLSVSFILLCQEWLWLLLTRRSKLKSFPPNGNLFLRIEGLHGIIILSLRIELIERSVLSIHSESWIFRLIISLLVPLCPLVGLRPPSNFFIYSVSLPVLSEKQLQKAFFLHAGVTKRVTSHAAHRGIWDGAGATTSWLHSGTLKKFLPRSKNDWTLRFESFRW